MSNWIRTVDRLPPDNVVVDTKIDDDQNGVRNEQPLQRHHSLWWFESNDMYVYYVPTHWKIRKQ